MKRSDIYEYRLTKLKYYVKRFGVLPKSGSSLYQWMITHKNDVQVKLIYEKYPANCRVKTTKSDRVRNSMPYGDTLIKLKLFCETNNRLPSKSEDYRLFKWTSNHKNDPEVQPIYLKYSGNARRKNRLPELKEFIKKYGRLPYTTESRNLREWIRTNLDNVEVSELYFNYSTDELLFNRLKEFTKLHGLPVQQSWAVPSEIDIEMKLNYEWMKRHQNEPRVQQLINNS